MEVSHGTDSKTSLCLCRTRCNGRLASQTLFYTALMAFMKHQSTLPGRIRKRTHDHKRPLGYHHEQAFHLVTRRGLEPDTLHVVFFDILFLRLSSERCCIFRFLHSSSAGPFYVYSMIDPLGGSRVLHTTRWWSLTAIEQVDVCHILAPLLLCLISSFYRELHLRVVGLAQPERRHTCLSVHSGTGYPAGIFMVVEDDGIKGRKSIWDAR